MKSENIKISKRHYQTEQVSTINNCAIAWKLNIQLALQLFPIKSTEMSGTSTEMSGTSTEMSGTSTEMSGTSTAACRFRILGLLCLKPLSKIFPFYRGGYFYCWEETVVPGENHQPVASH